MKKLKLKLEDFEVSPLTKGDLLKVLGGDNISTTQQLESATPEYTLVPISNREVETSKEI